MTCTFDLTEVAWVEGELPGGTVELDEVDRDKVAASGVDQLSDGFVVGHDQAGVLGVRGL